MSFSSRSLLFRVSGCIMLISNLYTYLQAQSLEVKKILYRIPIQEQREGCHSGCSASVKSIEQEELYYRTIIRNQ